MVTRNVIQRVFNIRIDNTQGSAFTHDHQGRQYLVTARHVAEAVPDAQRISRAHENEWKDINLTVVGFGNGEVDVAVLAASEQLSPTLPMEASTQMTLGQHAYFLGFPFGWDSGAEHINDGYPVPFIKGGIVSAMRWDGPVHKIYIDAHVNSGFSGGPVVFRPNEQPGRFMVAGVVAGYPRRFQPVVDKQGNEVARALENPGLVVALGISHVEALIDRNPIGFALPNA